MDFSAFDKIWSEGAERVTASWLFPSLWSSTVNLLFFHSILCNFPLLTRFCWGEESGRMIASWLPPCLWCSKSSIIKFNIMEFSTLDKILLVWRGGEGDCLLAASFLMEFSTPFVSLRVILCQLGLKVRHKK